MAAVNALPVVERDQREESGQVAERNVEALRLEERLMSALVQQREPLHHRDREQRLSPEPERPLRLQGEIERQARKGDALTGDPRACTVGRAKVNELGG